jgi:hypothetical protein
MHDTLNSKAPYLKPKLGRRVWIIADHSPRTLNLQEYMSKYPKKLLHCFVDNIRTTLIKALPFYLVYHDDFVNFVTEKIFRWNKETFFASILFFLFVVPLLASLTLRNHLNEFTRELFSTASELFISANQIILGLTVYSSIAIIESWPTISTNCISTAVNLILFVSFIVTLATVTTFLVWIKNNIISMQASEVYVQKLKLLMHRLASKLFRTALNTISKTKKILSSLAFIID